MKPICPNCGSDSVDAVVFGIYLPSSLGDLAAAVFGSVERQCRPCGYRWVEKEKDCG